MILQCRVIASYSVYFNQVYFFILELMVKECSEDIRSRYVRGTRGNKKHEKLAQILLNSVYLRRRQFIGCQKRY